MPVYRSVSRPRFTAAAIALAWAVTIVPAAPAGATRPTGPGSCPDGSVCFWSGGAFAGEMVAVPKPSSPGCGPTPARPARSVVNHDNQFRSFYTGGGCKGDVITIAPGGSFTAPGVYIHSWK
ncbi:peptidase inhibitor family I36 protein [Actinomadura macrotermitis]|uniref:Peptidase inhibitor family I36 n=1 Tax=Actinomadura macrotermitis TaxID=2585200 RepID=A0A7K0C897_9ACTN|nr:peptidase inhibitor family I36 protein [Actinomadura macrotermitis]MQY09687.1 hypothetical protein [Actinomadura macrotermitis]